MKRLKHVIVDFLLKRTNKGKKKKRTVRLPNRQPNYRQKMAHFTVSGGNDAEVDLVLIQPYLLCYVHHAVLTLANIFQALFPLKKDAGSYQNKINLSFTFTQRLGH